MQIARIHTKGMLNGGHLDPAVTPERIAQHTVPRQALRPSIKSQFLKILITFDDKCPRNGFKNDTMVPRTTLGRPHASRGVPYSLDSGISSCRPFEVKRSGGVLFS